MLLWRKPTPERIKSFLERRAEVGFSYEEVGATAGKHPSGYVVDHTRVELGVGIELFNSAKVAIQKWSQFNLGWVEARPFDTPIREGELVAIVARSFGLWWLNACRIVYTVDEGAAQPKFGFAYGTLPDHAGSGEERFVIEMDADGKVWYDVLAFSRPRHPLAHVGYPFMRRVQQRFGRQSAAHMKHVSKRRRRSPSFGPKY